MIEKIIAFFNSHQIKLPLNILPKKDKILHKNYQCLIGRVHPNDDMFIKEDILHYVNVGLNALQNIEETLEIAGKRFENINNYLDMPCGYGRVLRFVQCKIPPSKITASEINEEAVMFCSSEFGVKHLLSNIDFTKIKFDDKYDLIWVGSLFTHIDSKQFSILLTVLYNILEENGILIFTTHGEYSIETFGRQFSWDTIPGNENFRLLRFLKNELSIGWAENAQIIKTNDGKKIQVSSAENSVEIVLDEKEQKALLKISDCHTYDLQVKKDNNDNKLYIYRVHPSLGIDPIIY
ncbi:MAG: class I SAM-dependent methyltransferase [Candidatus Methanoperedenaceae archaeon]|nr:class I SAM-dependent methyltransferase [Candidatus Methanoperedenaceae archaeon]